METTYQYLRFVSYAAIRNWSVQYLKDIHLMSSFFPVRRLGDFVCEESQKYDISNPDCEYGILGVNNQTGVFDAYTQSGAKIKQKYKKMEEGWIAYNPYRVNVGSVGVKQACHQNYYISPAYVVFSCKRDLQPDFLYLVMRTPIFNDIIRRNTTGSVRQSLSYKALQSLEMPLPSLEEQNKLVADYNNIILESKSLIQKTEQEEEAIKEQLYSILGLIKNYGNNPSKRLRFIHYKDTLTRWDVYAIKEQYKSKWPVQELGQLITSISTGTTPPTNQKEYFGGDICFYTPADISGEMYLQDSERYLSQKAIDENKARTYRKGTILFVGIGSTVGKVGIVEKSLVSSNQQITGFTVNEQQVIPEYVYCFLHYNKDISTSEQAKTTLPIVNQTKIAKIPIPVPPKEVQEAIVAYTKEKRKEIEQLRLRTSELRKQAISEFEKALFK